MQATEDLKFGAFFLGSFEIQKLVYERAEEGKWLDLVDLLHTAAKNPLVGSISGSMLEAYGHESCLQGVKLDDDVREVFRKKRGRPRKEKGAEEKEAEGRGLRQAEEGAEEASEKELGRSGERDEAIREIQETFKKKKKRVEYDPKKPINLAAKDTYVMSKAPNETSWDGLVSSGDGWTYAVQFTRNPNHGLIADAIEKLSKLVKGSGLKGLRVILAVPPEKFDGYGWQPWTGEETETKDGKRIKTKNVLPEKKVPHELKGIQQWVVRLKLPEASDMAPRITRVTTEVARRRVQLEVE
jgi:hypothetical protein